MTQDQPAGVQENSSTRLEALEEPLDYDQFHALFPDVIERFPQLKLPAIDDSRFYFDPVTAYNALRFFEDELIHTEGPLKGEKFRPEPWQGFVISAIYGWKTKTFDENDEWICTEEQIAIDLRKFVEIFLFIPRKNGKSFFGSGIALYGLFADGELGAKVVSAAAEREQAALIYETARAIVEENPNFQEAVTLKRSMAIPSQGSNYTVLSADANTKHGKNLSTIIIDELHAQPNRELVDVLFTSTGARLQPLKVMLTTAGHDRKSICYEYYEYAKKVQEGITVDDEFLPIIFEAQAPFGDDAGDDWKDEATWYKANPNLGISVTLKYFRSEFKKALERPSYENTFKRLHLNMWTEQDTRWLPVDMWLSCNEPMIDLTGATGYGGVDLSTKVDISAYVMCFPIDDFLYIIPHFWVPAATIPARKKNDRVDYEVWVKQGYIQVTPGKVINYDAIKRGIVESYGAYRIQHVGFDPWNAQDIIPSLEEQNVSCVDVGQSMKVLANPTKRLEELIRTRRIVHGGNPVMNWMFSNIAVIEDANKNVRLSKKVSKEKIDGMMALVNAMAMWLADCEIKKPSVYSTRGVRTIG